MSKQNSTTVISQNSIGQNALNKPFMSDNFFARVIEICETPLRIKQNSLSPKQIISKIGVLGLLNPKESKIFLI